MTNDRTAPVAVRLPAVEVTLAGDSFGDAADPPVMLLHGGGQTRHSWRHTAEELGASGWNAVSVDLRGHGDSDWSPDGLYQIDYFAADVRAAAQSFTEPPALVGASLGGISSLLAIAEASEPIAAALVLVDVAPRIETLGVERIHQFMRSGIGGFATLEDAADAIAAYNPHRPRPKDLNGLKKNLRLRQDGRWHWHWDPRFMEPLDVQHPSPGLDGIPQPRFTPAERLEDAARMITVPTLLVRGGSSDLLSEEGARALLELIPHAHYADVAGAGHMVAGDRNDRFNAAVTEFLRTEVRPTMRG
ncbi:MAG: alpha/beta fold hydrolase [Acidimicrobiia bacterium]